MKVVPKKDKNIDKNEKRVTHSECKIIATSFPKMHQVMGFVLRYNQGKLT